jgi:type I restriction enzyme S subunit
MSAQIEVPVEWDRLNIGECASVKRGASPRPIEDPKWWGGEIGWVRISDVTSARKYLFKTSDYLSAAGVRQSVRIEVGEVVMSICATIGRSIITTFPVCIHDGFVWFDGLGDHIDREYFYYYLASKEAEFSGHRQIGTQGNLNTTIVSKVDLLIPKAKAEQSKIAEILSTIDRAIEQTEALIAKQERIKTGLMQDLLTRGIDEHGNLRSEATHKFKDSPLGRIPVEWEMITLDMAAEFVTSGSRGWAQYYSLEGALFLRIGNLTRRHINMRLDDCVRVSPPASSEGKRTALKSGDLLISITADLGIIGVIPEVFEESYVNQHIALVRLKMAEVNPRFIGWFLSSNCGRTQFEKLNESGAKAGLNLPMIRSLRIPKMNIAECNQIARLLDENSKATLVWERELLKLRSLKTALMQDLLTGRKRVTGLCEMVSG